MDSAWLKVSWWENDRRRLEKVRKNIKIERKRKEKKEKGKVGVKNYFYRSKKLDAFLQIPTFLE